MQHIPPAQNFKKMLKARRERGKEFRNGRKSTSERDVVTFLIIAIVVVLFPWKHKIPHGFNAGVYICGEFV